MGRIEVKVLKVLRDNYVFLVHHRGTNTAAVVDPGIAGPIINKLDLLGWRVKKVLCTHHHADQIGGNLDMRRVYKCDIVGPAAEAPRIPGITVEVKEGDKVTIGDAEGDVMELPGHTSGHIAYYFRDSGILFCGDVLYPLGSGRLFEGNAEQMWAAMQRLRALPGDTKVYCAHEYFERNYKFARGVDRDNAALKARGDNMRGQLQSGGESVPFTIAEEVATNPFFRADDPGLQKSLGMSGKSPIAVFTELRKRRDEA